jgi:hypothetical protein
MAERTAKLVEKHLGTIAREKRRRHPSSDRPFQTVGALAWRYDGNERCNPLTLVSTEDDSAAQRTAKLVEKHLIAVAREKRRRHPPSDRPFRPLVLSLGGMMETEARDALKLWKSIITGGVYSLLVRWLSLGLLRARARCFEP